MENKHDKTEFCDVIVVLFSASEAEMPPAIRRAESCESVASDSSVLEMQPDMPKIGQLEFALEYDRYNINISGTKLIQVQN